MAFYSPPSIILQWKSGEKISDTAYTCIYKRTDTCSMNFSLSETTHGYVYAWKVDGAEIYRGKNPVSWKLTPGDHEIVIASYYKESITPIDESWFRVHVFRAPKKSKISKKTSQIKIATSHSIIPEVHADTLTSSEPTTGSESDGFGFLVFGSGAGIAYLMRRRL